jgi:hypothetical protein
MIKPIIENPGKEVDQFSTVKSLAFQDSLNGQTNKWAESKVVSKGGKDYV